jgi:glycosyltransferase involved in cell wall biosynthesis/ubiquinone/menaquinone biosynthesis C-methylase UbiE
MGLEVDHSTATLDPYKDDVRTHYDALAGARDGWYSRNRYYHSQVENAVAAIIPPASSVLELGSGTGNLLNALQPSPGVGLDVSEAMVAAAQRKYPHLAFAVADVERFQLGRDFDFIVASDLIGELGDIAAMLERVHDHCHDQTRLVLTFHNPVLEGVLRLAQRLGVAMRPSRQNWIGLESVSELLELSDFEVASAHSELLVPVQVPLVASLANGRLSQWRGVRYLNLLFLVAARPRRPRPKPQPLSCTVVIPCRNELDNIEPAVLRTPEMGTRTELIFVDGASNDGTKERIEEVIERFRAEKDIKLIPQLPNAAYGGSRVDPATRTAMLKMGKGDAVRKGFDAATGDVLMILDADLTVPPEDLPYFFSAIATGKGEFVNGTRLVYPMEERAMKFFNYVGNWFFSKLFTWLLEQPIRDTLCGTKVLTRQDYERIKAERSYFGDFDPFGDFDLLFGAARLKLKIREVPVRYRRRTAGVSKVRIWKHGWLLMGMSLIAFRKLKVAKWTGRG